MCNGCNGASLGDHGVPEGDRVPSLESHRKVKRGHFYFYNNFGTCGTILIILSFLHSEINYEKKNKNCRTYLLQNTNALWSLLWTTMH